MGDIVILCMSSTVGNNFDSWALSAELGRHVPSLTLTFVVCDDHLTKPKMRLKQRVLSGAPRCIPIRMYTRQRKLTKCQFIMPYGRRCELPNCCYNVSSAKSMSFMYDI